MFETNAPSNPSKVPSPSEVPRRPRRGTRPLTALTAVVCLGIGASRAESQSAGCPGQSGPYVNYAREVLTISSTALPFTATVYQPSGTNPPLMAMVTLETNPIRHSTNGLAPTAAVGELKTAPTQFMVCGEVSIKRFLAIRTGSDASITVSYWNFGQ